MSEPTHLWCSVQIICREGALLDVEATMVRALDRLRDLYPDRDSDDFASFMVAFPMSAEQAHEMHRELLKQHGGMLDTADKAYVQGKQVKGGE